MSFDLRALPTHSGITTGTTWDTNLLEVGGTATDVNQGVAGAGTQRVSIATDDEPNVDITSVDGSTITTGAGVVAAGTPRITLASDDPAVSVLGATNDAKVETDAVGSISAKLRGVVSRLVELVTTIGATDDAKVDTDVAGSLSAKLRGLVSLAAAWTRNSGAADADTLRVSVATDDVLRTRPKLVIDWTEAPEQVSVSDVSATSSQLSSGWYAMSCTCDVHVKQGGAAVTAAATDREIYGGITYLLHITGSSDDYVAGFTDGANGTLELIALKEVS